MHDLPFFDLSVFVWRFLELQINLITAKKSVTETLELVKTGKTRVTTVLL